MIFFSSYFFLKLLGSLNYIQIICPNQMMLSNNLQSYHTLVPHCDRNNLREDSCASSNNVACKDSNSKLFHFKAQ